MPGIYDVGLKRKGFKGFGSAYDADVKQADLYRAALEKAAYGDFGREYGAGLDQITNYLARSGPLADSGAGTALRAKLASQLYGQAQGRIQGGYADFLRQLIAARNQKNYQAELMRLQKKMQSTGVGGFLGGVAGAFGGPFLGAAGEELGKKIIR